jgi:hypothetical protein
VHGLVIMSRLQADVRDKGIGRLSVRS